MTFLANRQRLNDPSGVLVLLEISAPSITGVLRLANDTKDWQVRGQTYTGFPFGFDLPDDSAGQTPKTQLVISNVGRALTADLEGLAAGDVLMARVMVADKAAPDVFECDFNLPVSNVSVNQATVTAALGVDHVMRQQCSRVRYTPFNTPGVFQ